MERGEGHNREGDEKGKGGEGEERKGQVPTL